MAEPVRKPDPAWPPETPGQRVRPFPGDVVHQEPPAPVTRPVPPPVTREARLIDLDALNLDVPLDAHAIGWSEPTLAPADEALGLVLFRAGQIALSLLACVAAGGTVWAICARLA